MDKFTATLDEHGNKIEQIDNCPDDLIATYNVTYDDYGNEIEVTRVMNEYGTITAPIQRPMRGIANTTTTAF